MGIKYDFVKITSVLHQVDVDTHIDKVFKVYCNDEHLFNIMLEDICNYFNVPKDERRAVYGEIRIDDHNLIKYGKNACTFALSTNITCDPLDVFEPRRGKRICRYKHNMKVWRIKRCIVRELVRYTNEIDNLISGINDDLINYDPIDKYCAEVRKVVNV